MRRGVTIAVLAMWMLARADAAAVIISHALVFDSGQPSFNIAEGFSAGAGFTMGAQGYDITSVTVELYVRSAIVNSFQAELFGDAGGAPGGPALGTFHVGAFVPGPAAFGGNFGTRTLTPQTTLALAPFQTYYLVLTADVSHAANEDPNLPMIFGWQVEQNGGFPANYYTGVATFAGFWQSLADPPQTPVKLTAPVFEVDGTQNRLVGVRCRRWGRWG